MVSIKTFDLKDSIKYSLRDDNAGQGSIAEDYKKKLTRKTSQAAPISRRTDTLGEILNQNNTLDANKEKERQIKANDVGNPNTYKNAENRRNNSTVFGM